jgi:hypothetical protein
MGGGLLRLLSLLLRLLGPVARHIELDDDRVVDDAVDRRGGVVPEPGASSQLAAGIAALLVLGCLRRARCR